MHAMRLAARAALHHWRSLPLRNVHDRQPAWLHLLTPCLPARPPAVGCINVVPGLWQPEWVPATVLLYHPPMTRVVTVIFEDEGELFRHAIDFQGEWVCAYQKSCRWRPARTESGFERLLTASPAAHRARWPLLRAEFPFVADGFVSTAD